MRKKMVLVTFLFVACLLGAGLAVYAQQQFYVFPAQGQTKDQQEQDEFSCHKWAVEQSGVDPKQVAREGAQPAGQPTTARPLRSGLGGAVLGAGIGAIAGDAKKGAAIGGGVGAVSGARRRNQQEQQSQAAQQQKSQNSQNQLNQYDRAYEACLVGRGYTVK